MVSDHAIHGQTTWQDKKCKEESFRQVSNVPDIVGKIFPTSFIVKDPRKYG
jgi:hypothetical protein